VDGARLPDAYAAGMGRWSAVFVRGLAAVLLTACAAPGGGAAGGQGALYVANALDDSLTRLDGQSGHVIGPDLPAGRAPGQLAPGPAGSLLALSAAADRDGEVTHLARSAGRGARDWLARPLPLGEPARRALLAGDGAGDAVVGYHASVPGESGGTCRLALVDVNHGVVRRTHTVCAPRETMTGLALAGGPGGGIAFVGLSRRAAGAGGGPAAGHRIVALNAETGAVVASRGMAGPPEHLTVAPGTERSAPRLYCVVGSDYVDADETIPARGRLLGLDPATLADESEFLLPAWPSALAVAPDGGRAYGLTPGGGSLMDLDLGRGVEGRRAGLPGRGTRLAVGERWVYVANTAGDEVWQLDRGDGRLARSIRVGRRPIGLALGPA
jgi:DNA-binding beta-propeller fold protein YncE